MQLAHKDGITSFGVGTITAPVACLPAALWGHGLSWGHQVPPIKITVILKVNVTVIRTASQVTQQNPSNCQRLQGKCICLTLQC